MKNPERRKEFRILILIVCAAILARVFIIWIGRPEFVGWFSHTYYYFVEVEGLLRDGSLVYPDMPLLFYFYALISKILMFFGVETKPAIVASTRLVMSVVPALMAIPVYFLIRSINHGKSLTKLNWLLILISVFPPLSLTHLTEILQKNMFGLVLFTFLQPAIYRLLKTYSLKRLLPVIALSLGIFLTHLGTFGATVFFFLAVTAALLITGGFSDNKSRVWLFSIPIFAVLLFLLIYLIDVSRFDRIIYYAGRSLSNSQIGLLFSSQTLIEKLQFLAAILFTAFVAFWLFRLYKKHLNRLSKTDQVFWLSNVIFVYLIAAPVLDLDLVVRFILFSPISFIIILIYLLKHLQSEWLKRALVGLFLLISLTTAFGEVMGVFMRNADNRSIEREMVSIRNRQIFRPDDFVITKYGVNPICNWFFETKSGLITSLNREDFKRYGKIYILNPKEGELSSEAIEKLTGRTIRTEAEKYQIMRNNILVPKDAKPVLQTDNLEIFELESPPADWAFDSEGNWIGYLKD
ncbi:MAG: hypothetical protein R2747_02670 [Pyrinomonadaceae bacterium]